MAAKNKKKKTASKAKQPEEIKTLELEKYLGPLKVGAIVLSVIFALVLTVYILLVTFTVNTVYVEGNEHYTAAEIRNIVQNRWFGNNSIYLSLAYSGNSIKGVPFIETIDVDVLDRHSIKITVYEKKLAGYVEYLGNYVYFDRDGVVVETSRMKTANIPLVTGLDFDHFVMYEQLPVKDVSVFQNVLNITQLLNKYEIPTDKIFFADNGEVTLYFAGVRVGLGKPTLLEEKIQRLDAILPMLEGYKGFLEMSNYDDGKENFTFTKDK